jgi:hypothetical protein
MRELGRIIQHYGIPYKLYADDIQLFLSFSPAEEGAAIKMLEACLQAIHVWLSSNMLSLNPSKSELLLLGSRQQLAKLPAFSISLGGAILTPKGPVRDLGVMLDSSLSLDHHVTTICKKAFSYLHVIARVRRTTGRQNCALLIHSLVLSRLDFCAPLLLNISSCLITKMQRVINAAVRILVRGTSSSSAAVEMRRLNWLSAEQRIHYRALMILHTSLNKFAPIFLANMFTPSHNPRHLRSSDYNLLSVPFRRTEMGKRAFSCAAAALWNSIPQDIRDVKKKEIFSVQLHDYLMSVT